MKEKPSDPRESLWRRKLSEAELAGLQAQPELQREARLTDALNRLPNTTVPSNFTARVLQTIDLEEAATIPTRTWTWHWRSLLPRVGVVAAALFFAGVGVQRYNTVSYHKQLAKTVASATLSQPPPSAEVLENLDAIQRMSQSAHADGELLTDLQ